MKNPAQHPDGLDVKQMRGSRSGGFGIVLTSIGGAGLLWIGFEIITDMTGDLVRYSYKPPLTGHETSNLVFLVMSVVLLLLGSIRILRAQKKENKR
jgi:hypothetical protein